MKIEIIKENYFRNEDGTYNLDEALLLGGRIAGICYNKEGYHKLLEEDIEKTKRRCELTIGSGHHSVYGHCDLILYLQNIPKILAMVLNNEHEYNTSEKSARYTPVEKKNSQIITEKEEELYNKWMNIFDEEITKKYSNVYDSKKIKKLAQENARYLVTVFMDTQMIYKTSLRQINYIASFMQKYIDECDKSSSFNVKLSLAMSDFISELRRLNILEERLLKNEKDRSLSLFSKRYDDKKEIFSDIYLTKYKSSFAYLAQAQRHRTINYEMRIPKTIEFFVPPIIEDDKKLSKEWLKDCNSLKDVYPQGMLIDICENGTYENFILKCKERLCSAAQLEIMLKTREVLLEFKDALEKDNHPLKDDIVKYTKGARCTFPGFVCTSKCGFAEGIKLTRKI